MKKVLTIVISIALITALAIGGTLAYLSSNANGTNLENTFKLIPKQVWSSQAPKRLV